MTHPGWLQKLLSLMILCRCFDFKSVTVEEAEKMGITFPNLILVTRIPVEALPEDVAPPLLKENIPVCVANENFEIAESFVLLDIKGSRARRKNYR